MAVCGIVDGPRISAGTWPTTGVRGRRIMPDTLAVRQVQPSMPPRRPDMRLAAAHQVRVGDDTDTRCVAMRQDRRRNPYG